MDGVIDDDRRCVIDDGVALCRWQVNDVFSRRQIKMQSTSSISLAPWRLSPLAACNFFSKLRQSNTFDSQSHFT